MLFTLVHGCIFPATVGKFGFSTEFKINLWASVVTWLRILDNGIEKVSRNHLKHLGLK